MQLFAYKNRMTIFNSYPFPISLAVLAHIMGGTVALALFMVPLLSKKGGRAHVKSGWIYAAGMMIVSLSAFTITPWRFFFDPSRTDASRSFAFFLFFIAIFSLTALQQGIVVFKYKKRASGVKNARTLLLPSLLFLISTFTAVFGVATSKWLFLAFGLLALRTAYRQIIYWRSSPKHQRDWWFFHLENMFICCIATITAFAVTAAPRIFPSSNLDSIWTWLAPTAVMVPWMLWFNRKYERQFGLVK